MGMLQRMVERRGYLYMNCGVGEGGSLFSGTINCCAVFAVYTHN
jgi:hypothetical protein